MLIIGSLFVVALLALIVVVVLIRSEANDQKLVAQQATASSASTSPASQAVPSAKEEQTAQPATQTSNAETTPAMPEMSITDRETQALEQVAASEATVGQPVFVERRTKQMTASDEIHELIQQLQDLHRQTANQLQVLHQQSADAERRLKVLNEAIETYEYNNGSTLVGGVRNERQNRHEV